MSKPRNEPSNLRTDERSAQELADSFAEQAVENIRYNVGKLRASGAWMGIEGGGGGKAQDAGTIV